MFSPLGRGSECFPTYLSHPRSSRSHGSLYRAFRCVLCDWRIRLEHVSASSRSMGVFFTRARHVRAFWPPRVHVAAASSPLSEQRLERQRRRRCHRRHGGRYVAPQGLYADDCDIFGGSSRLRLRVASFLRGSALLRRRPETVAAHSRVGRPSASVSVERPPSAVQRWECLEVDLTEFKRKALRELSGVLDFHIRGVDEPVPAGRVCSFWKQLVEDNLAVAARIRYPRKWPPALRKWSCTFRALVVRTANW